MLKRKRKAGETTLAVLKTYIGGLGSKCVAHPEVFVLRQQIPEVAHCSRLESKKERFMKGSHGKSGSNF